MVAECGTSTSVRTPLAATRDGLGVHRGASDLLSLIPVKTGISDVRFAPSRSKG